MTSPTQFPVLEGLSEREQRAACVAFFESELTRLGLKRDEKWDRIMGELRTGINCERPRVTTSDKPAHPAPWRWTDERGGYALVAADHREATDDDDGHDSIVLSDRLMCIPGEMSPYVREVVRAAPEMADLLADIATALVFRDLDHHGPPDPIIAKIRPLLARLDEARRG